MQTKIQPIRVGIIGCGGYAHQLIVRMRTLPRHIQLVAATSRNPSSATAQFWSQRGIRVFHTLDELLDFAPGQIDVVMNPTPINVHKPTTLRCLQAGLPVWLEKPPVATVADLETLIEAGNGANLSIDVCFNSIYGNNVQRLKEEIVEGQFGKVERVRGVAGWVRDAAYFSRADWSGKLKLGEDWVFDGTINNPLAHLVCNNLYFAGPTHHSLATLESVEAYLWHGNAIETEDTSALRIRTEEGVEVLSHLTLCPEETITPATVIDTEKATLTLANFESVRIEWKDGRIEERPSFKENRIEMLEELSIRSQGEEQSLCPLEMCRPFVETVETAFRQVLGREDGKIPAIPTERIRKVPSGDSQAIQILGINRLFREAHAAGQLLDSEDLMAATAATP